MNPILEVQELTFSLLANNLISTYLTPKFLKESSIIPKDWEFAEPPQIEMQAAKVTFTNDIIILANLDTINFSEKLDVKNPLYAQTPKIVRKWVKTLPNLDYQTLNINLSSFFTFEKEDEKPFRHYIATTLLTQGTWQEISREPLRASLSLAYVLEQGQFTLKIDDVQLRQSDNSLQAGVMFSGNFSYEVTGITTSERLQHLHQLIENWREDLETYREIVTQKFLDKRLISTSSL